MNSTRALVFFLFWMALLADCFFILTDHLNQRIYTKPLLVPLLLIAVYIEAQNSRHTRSKMLFTTAFLFCFLGDVILFKDTNPIYFTLGLLSFLIAHIFLIFFFYRLKPFSLRHSMFFLITVFFVAAYIAILLFIIWENVRLQNFQIPVAAYASILGLMLITAIHTIKNRSIKRIAAKYFIPGAALFVLSDSLLAVTKFSFPFNYSSVPVMVTYASAIFLLANGAIKFLKK